MSDGMSDYWKERFLAQRQRQNVIDDAAEATAKMMGCYRAFLMSKFKDNSFSSASLAMTMQQIIDAYGMPSEMYVSPDAVKEFKKLVK